MAQKTSVLQELEDLRALLEQSPTRSVLPKQFRVTALATPSHQVTAMPSMTNNQALNIAERSVDRLGRAIEAAEEEMEAALRRTTEVHKSQLRQKEVELGELQRVLAAKERSIESLRDTLATTKRTYETRLAQTDSALSLRESEVIALREEVRILASERDSLSFQAQKQSREVCDLRDREALLAVTSRDKADEAGRLSAALCAERERADRAQAELAESKRKIKVMHDELKGLRLDSKAERERLEAEVEGLRGKLHTERGVRKACEKLLRLESIAERERLEMLQQSITMLKNELV